MVVFRIFCFSCYIILSCIILYVIKLWFITFFYVYIYIFMCVYLHAHLYFLKFTFVHLPAIYIYKCLYKNTCIYRQNNRSNTTHRTTHLNTLIYMHTHMCQTYLEFQIHICMHDITLLDVIIHQICYVTEIFIDTSNYSMICCLYTWAYTLWTWIHHRLAAKNGLALEAQVFSPWSDDDDPYI